MDKSYKCEKCKKLFDVNELYEYRGVFACSDHFDEVVSLRDFQRKEIILEENKKTEIFKGLDLGDSKIGKANQEILKRQIEIAKKENFKIKNYERPENDYLVIKKNKKLIMSRFLQVLLY